MQKSVFDPGIFQTKDSSFVSGMDMVYLSSLPSLLTLQDYEGSCSARVWYR